jgi:hypothetical protein
VLLAAALAVALAVAAAYALMLRPSEDARLYWPLSRAAQSPAEATLRWPEYPGGMMTINAPDPHYRRPWSEPARRPAEVPWRTLVLGDSHVYGLCPTGEAFTAVLDRDTSPAQVINCGVFGWGPLDALRFLRDDLKDARYERIILVFYLGNDLADLFRYGQHTVERAPDGSYRENEPKPLPRPTKLQCLMQDLGLSPEKGLPDPERRALLFRRMWLINPGAIEQEFWQSLYFQDQPAKVEEALGALENITGQMNAMARDRGATFTLVLLPTKRMVEPETVGDLGEAARRVLGLTPEFVGFDGTVRELIRKRFAKAPYEVLDLTPALQAAHAAAPGKSLFWRVDFHLNHRGHAVVAGELRKLLP